MSHTIGQKIKMLRELRNLTQDYMAIQLEISQSAYSKIETGASQITVQRLEHIALVLDVRIEDVFAFNVDRILTPQSN
jgi:transcriptional regulator with XRE-family HTH domain